MSLPDPASDRRELKALTSLRGVAAMAVVLQHFSATAQYHSAGWIPSLVPHGYMAVDFFFVLSGFIMSYTYLAGFQSLGMQAYGPFLWKRVARIFPLGLAVLALILIAGAVASHWGLTTLFINRDAIWFGLPEAIVLNILHLQGFFTHYNLNDPSWSISVELAAYLLFPVLIYLLFKAPAGVAVGFCAVGAAALAAVALSDPAVGLAFRFVPFDLARCVFEFGFGMLAYRAFMGQGGLRRIGRDGWTWAISAVCLLGFLLRFDLLAAFSFPFVVLAYALNRGAPSRLLSSPIPYFLGTISFSIYLVHHLFRAPELALLVWVHPLPVPPWAALAFALAGSLSVLPVAALAYAGVERPGRTALNRLVRHVRSRRQSPQPAGGPIA